MKERHSFGGGGGVPAIVANLGVQLASMMDELRCSHVVVGHCVNIS